MAKSKIQADLERDLEASQKLHQEIYGNGAQDDSGQDVSTDAGIVQQTVEPSIEPAQVADIQPVVVEAQQSTQQVIELEKYEALLRDYEALDHKNKTLAGKYNAEVPRLNKKLDEQGRELMDLQKTVSAMATQQVKPSVPEPAVNVSHPTKNKLVTQSDVDDYGEGFIDLATRISKDVLSEFTESLDVYIETKLNDRIGTISNDLGAIKTRQEQSIEEKYLSDLSTYCPSWMEIRDTEEFVSWLEEEDEFTGFQRMDILKNAVYGFDANRTARVYNEYIRSTNNNTNKQTHETIAQPPIEPIVNLNNMEQSPPPQTNPALEKLIQPNSSHASSIEPINDGKPKRSLNEITEAQEKVRRREMSYDEFNKLYREVNVARMEGRLVS